MVMMMKTYARMQNGMVAELLRTDAPIASLFHPGMTWIDVSSQPHVAEGWAFDGSQFAQAAAPAASTGLPTMPQVLADLAALKAEVAALRAQVAVPAKHS